MQKKYDFVEETVIISDLRSIKNLYVILKTITSFALIFRISVLLK